MRFCFIVLFSVSICFSDIGARWDYAVTETISSGVGNNYKQRVFTRSLRFDSTLFICVDTGVIINQRGWESPDTSEFHSRYTVSKVTDSFSECSVTAPSDSQFCPEIYALFQHLDTADTALTLYKQLPVNGIARDFYVKESDTVFYIWEKGVGLLTYEKKETVEGLISSEKTTKVDLTVFNNSSYDLTAIKSAVKTGHSVPVNARDYRTSGGSVSLSSGLLHLSFPKRVRKVNLISSTGRILMSKEADAISSMPVYGLAKGVYILHIYTVGTVYSLPVAIR